MKKTSKSNWKTTLFIIGALTPAMLVSLGLVIYPMINQVIRSFKDPKTGAFTFDNYIYLFTNKLSSNAIWYTVVISILTVLLSISIAYLLAMYLRFSDSKISKTIGNLYLELPKNRGEITEQQFYDNCAHIVKYDSITFKDVPVYKVSTDIDGHVWAVTYEIEYTEEDKEEYIYKHYNEMLVAFLALAGAQKEFNPVVFEYGSVSKVISGRCFTDYEYEYGGVKITNEVTSTGYARNILADYLYRLPEGTPYFKQTFTVRIKN